MNQTTPAIVPHQAAQAMPRAALLLLCLAYVVPGFFGRAPWKSIDMTALGYMQALAHGHTTWLAPELLGMPVDATGLLPYWVGAWAIQWAPAWLPGDIAARLPFLGFLAATIALTWWAAYRLASHPGAQPVAFAFGGEPDPQAYARAVADGALLALLACLGLAQRGHETSVYLAQVCFTALLLCAVATALTHPRRAMWAMVLGHTGLTLSGAPTLSLLFGLGTLGIGVVNTTGYTITRVWQYLLAALLVGNALLAASLNLWPWQLVLPGAAGHEWESLLKLAIWFGWPAWPLALWTLWQWRHQIQLLPQYPHLAIPLWFTLVVLVATLLTPPADRMLLLGLPALAILAAFALPTLKRGLAAWIEWFTLLFFSISVLAIWTIWLAMQTGFPAKPAANIARLAPSFTPTFEWFPAAVALLGSLAWALLVWWRALRHRTPLWKTLLLPASGAGLCWLLLNTLWLPLLDHARSYTVQIDRLRQITASTPGCITSLGLGRPQVAALIHHGAYEVRLPDASAASCPWMVSTPSALAEWPAKLDLKAWRLVARIERPTDRNDPLWLLKHTETGALETPPTAGQDMQNPVPDSAEDSEQSMRLRTPPSVESETVGRESH